MNNIFDNYMICKNDFFKNPDKVLALFSKQQFFNSPSYPGIRTHNLLESVDEETRNFGLFFAQKIADEIYPGIYGFMIDVRFHINQVYNETKVNEGWIHCDDADLAGVVYMTKEELSLKTGTSMFIKSTEGDFPVKDFNSRQEFNVTGVPTETYITDLESNHKHFTETLRVGNLYNRLISYDAKIYHRPNRYNLESVVPRKSIVFFIKGFKREYTPKVNLNFKWEDV
jgi:hypothetical protein